MDRLILSRNLDLLIARKRLWDLRLQRKRKLRVLRQLILTFQMNRRGSCRRISLDILADQSQLRSWRPNRGSHIQIIILSASSNDRRYCKNFSASAVTLNLQLLLFAVVKTPFESKQVWYHFQVGAIVLYVSDKVE